MAERTLIVRVIGDDRSLQAAMLRDQKAVTAFGTTATTQMGRVEGAFARTKGIAAGGFVGGTVLLAAALGIKKVVDAQENAQLVLNQTKVALEATGKSWDQYGQQIENAVRKQSQLGFDDEELLKTFSLFVRQTNDVNKALHENELAMDLARARSIDLASAANIVNKAALGQAGSLRRIGIDAKNGSSGLELLALLSDKYGGSAEAANKTTQASFDRAAVAVQNLEESLGDLLDGPIAGIADSVASASQELADFVDQLHALADVRVPPIHIPFLFEQDKGSTIGSILGKATFTLGDFIKLTKNQLNKTIDDFKGDSKKAGEEIRTSLPDFVSIFNNSFKDSGPTLIDILGKSLTGKPTVSGVIGNALDKVFSVARKDIGSAISDQKKRLQDAADEKLADSFQNLIASLQLGVDKAGLTKTLSDDLSALEALKAGLQKQIKAGVDVTSAQSQLVTVAQQIADKQEEIRAAAQAAIQARQFRALGLSAAGEEIVPGVDTLQKQLRQLTQRLADSGADLPSKLAQQLAGARKVLTGELGKATKESRDKINELFKTIRQTFDQNTKQGDFLTKGDSKTAQRALDALGLSDALEHELRLKLTPFSRGNLPGGNLSSAAFVNSFQQQPITVQSTTTVLLDGDVVGRAVKRSQQKDARRNPRQRRGPNRGL